MWVPAEDRGNFSDRFGRFRFASLATVPTPKNSKVLEEFHLPQPSFWFYARNFASLESDLAKGVAKIEPKWNSSVRWRRWVRKRKVLNRESLSEIMSGWLGCKERRGTWKSRYFILVGGGGAPSHFTSGNAPGDDSEDDSSADEAGDIDETDPPEERSALTLQVKDDDNDNQVSPGADAKSPTELQLSGAATINCGDIHPPVLLYFRRGFLDPRAMFAMSFDVAELRSFPKKQIRVLKFSGKTKVDDTLSSVESPGRFAIKHASGSKRVLNAASSDVKERWVEAIRTVVEEGFLDHPMSPLSSQRKSGRIAAAIRAAKRGQQELRKGFGNLRRSSVGSSNGLHLTLSTSMGFSGNSPNILPTPSLFSPTILATPHTQGIISPIGHEMRSPFVVEMLRTETGTLGLKLSEVPGRGLRIEGVHDSARDASGSFPTNLAVGDEIVSVMGENLHGSEGSIRKLREVLSRVPKDDKIVLTLSGSCSLLKRHSSSPPMEFASQSPRVAHSKVISSSAPSDFELRSGDETESERDDALSHSDSFKSLPPNTTESRSPSLRNINSGEVTHVPKLIRQKSVDVPLNSANIASTTARTVTMTSLERMIQHGPVTYAQLRNEVANQLQAIQVMDSDEWRLWFRDFLDYWICDGNKYAVGGLDMADFTPVILKVESSHHAVPSSSSSSQLPPLPHSKTESAQHAVPSSSSQLPPLPYSIS